MVANVYLFNSMPLTTKVARDENAHLSEAKHHLSILISAAEMQTLTDIVEENSGDFVSFNSPKLPA